MVFTAFSLAFQSRRASGWHEEDKIIRKLVETHDFGRIGSATFGLYVFS